MAVEKFYDAGIFFNGWNLSGQSNQVTLNRSAAMLDATVFGNETKVNAPGLDEIAASVSGFWTVDATALGGGPDPGLFNQLGSTGKPLTIYPKNTDLGVAFMFPAVESTFTFFGPFGELAPFNAEYAYGHYGSSGLKMQSRGVIGLQATARTAASGNGTGIQLGALSSTMWLVMAVHVVATDSSSLTFTVESDDNAGFTTPTTRITSGVLAGGSGGQSFYAHLQGPLTDDYYRATWSRSGGTTHTTLVTFGAYEPKGLAA